MIAKSDFYTKREEKKIYGKIEQDSLLDKKGYCFYGYYEITFI